MARPLRAVPLAALALPAIAAAQDAPAPLEPAPPTEEDRAIYALVERVPESPEAEAVLLLDEARVTLHPDGTSTFTIRTVRHVRSERAARAAAELSFSWDAGREELELDWARVVDAEGTVLSGPVHLQELDRPVRGTSPVYTDVKILRGSLGAVGTGTIVDVQHRRTIREPVLPGDFVQRWFVNGGQPIMRSRLVVDAPAEVELRIREENVPAPARIERTADRIVREWAYEDVARIEPEPFAADSNSIQQRITVGGPTSWEEIGSWYEDLSEDRYAVGPEVRAALSEVVGDATTLSDSLRSVHRWIAQDIRYVSISLGIGGYQPRMPAEVIESRLGDCKDKATLFIALARHMGAEAYPVLISTGGAFLEDVPTPRQFNHMVAALRDGEGWRYLDLTVPIAPFDEVYAGIQGRTGLMIAAGGRPEIVHIPASPAEKNTSMIRITGALDADGGIAAEYLEVVTGAIQYRIRDEFDEPRNDRLDRSLRQNLAARVASGAGVDTMEIFDGLDLETVPRLWARVSGDDVLQEVPGGYLFPVRLASYASSELIGRLEAEGGRSFPLDAEKVFGRREHRTEYEIELPEGWTADLPEDVRAESLFGLYASTYEQEGRTLRIERVMRGSTGIHPPEAMEDLIAWFRILAEDRVEHIALRPAGG